MHALCTTRRDGETRAKHVATVEIVNFTGGFSRAETFVRSKANLVVTEGLSVHIKFTRARGRDINGYYRWADHRMVLAVKKRLRFPRAASYAIATTPLAVKKPGARPYRLVWHEERFDSPEDLLVFVAGHEFWHFLCHTGQRKRDHETKANCHGFTWLREFRTWPGEGHPVEPIPLLPSILTVSAAATRPAPYLVDTSSQLSLFT